MVHQIISWPECNCNDYDIIGSAKGYHMYPRSTGCDDDDDGGDIIILGNGNLNLKIHHAEKNYVGVVDSSISAS